MLPNKNLFLYFGPPILILGAQKIANRYKQSQWRSINKFRTPRSNIGNKVQPPLIIVILPVLLTIKVLNTLITKCTKLGRGVPRVIDLRQVT